MPKMKTAREISPSAASTTKSDALTVPPYLADSRSLLNCVVLVLPLFVIYQLGVLTTEGVQNGLDFVTRVLRFTLLGGNTVLYIVFNLVVLVALVGVVVFLRRKQRFNPKIYWAVVVESTLYGVVLGFLVSTVLSKVGITPASDAPVMGPLDNFVLSLGAGLYEELVFRLILLGGSVWGVTALWRWHKRRAAGGADKAKDVDLTWVEKAIVIGGAVLVTSLLFSGVHYVGSMADTFTLYSFSFRFLLGALFAGLFYVRGFAVAVYTHAIYDVIVLVLLNAGAQ